MSNIGLDFGSGDEPTEVRLPQAGSRRAEPSRARRVGGCLPILLVLALVAGGAWLGGGWVVGKVKELTGSSPDYSSTSTTPGKDAVLIEVHAGDNAGAIGRTLKAAGVVKSVDAFVDAAAKDDRSRGIQVGFYRLNKKLKAAAALKVLINPANLIKATVTIPEGFRVKQVAERLIAQTKFGKKAVNAAIANPRALGLPAEAGGNLEGYLFPATYTILPGATAKSLLTQMVDKTKQVEKELGIAAKAAALNLTPHQVLTVASILEYEAGTGADYPKVARVLYNRLADGMKLQLDSTVAFANNITGSIYTTAAQREIDSPYNTYRYGGLPPGPIGSPGEMAIKAALNPTAGDWLYFVLVNPETGETRFNTTREGHDRDAAVFDRYCRDHQGAC